MLAEFRSPRSAQAPKVGIVYAKIVNAKRVKTLFMAWALKTCRTVASNYFEPLGKRLAKSLAV